MNHGPRFFGPVLVFAALLILVRSVMTRRFDRWLAAACAFMVVAYLLTEQISRTDAGRHLATLLLKGLTEVSRRGAQQAPEPMFVIRTLGGGDAEGRVT